MILSSDNLSEQSEKSKSTLHKLFKPTNVVAKFDDKSFKVGRVHLGEKQVIAVFNDQDESLTWKWICRSLAQSAILDRRTAWRLCESY
ncbi:hypothetical protein [Paenibacillus albus]|uniref:Uncharacterized protein n=1 Tax=Paenibacillus albus TaxID=2495582 RepID=A0A3Q8X9B4_9BACL|nr:hypothetical protein [Paenibacillus albus]AZN42933.1 hypothetical protein EJC50_26985 [Paenibacillus albus]